MPGRMKEMVQRGLTEVLADDQCSVTVNYQNGFLSSTHSNPLREVWGTFSHTGQESKAERD